MLPLNKHVLSKPRSGVQSSVTKRALLANFIPPVLKFCQVVTIRAVFAYGTRQETVTQIAARRRQIELALLSNEEVSFLLLYFCLWRSYLVKNQIV